MKDINLIVDETAEGVYKYFNDQIDVFDKEQTVEEVLYDVVPEYIKDNIIYREDLDSVKAFCFNLNENCNDKLKQQALNEMIDDGFIDSLIDGSEEIDSYYELDDFVKNLKDGNVNFKDLPDMTWGELFVAFDDFSDKVENEIYVNAFVNLESEVYEDVNYIFENKDINISDITVGEYIEEYLNEKGLNDLIADVEIEDKEVKEKQDREIEER